MIVFGLAGSNIWEDERPGVILHTRLCRDFLQTFPYVIKGSRVRTGLPKNELVAVKSCFSFFYFCFKLLNRINIGGRPHITL